MDLKRIGNTLLMFLGLFVLLGPELARHDPDAQQLALRFLEPSRDFWLGTDELGRDVFSRLAFGGRVSLGIAFSSLILAGLTGSAVGFCAGFFRGVFGQFVQGAIDFLQSFPGILFGMIVTAFFEPHLALLVVAISISYFAGFARLARAKMMQLLGSPLFDACVVLGESPWRILGVHLVPLCVYAVVAYAEINFASVLLVTSSFGFLGFGGTHLQHEWGTMLGEGRSLIRSHPGLQVYPGLMIFITVLGFNLRRTGRWVRQPLH